MTELQYKKAIVTYVDILGFRELIERSKANAAETSKIFELLRTVKDDFSAGGRVAMSEQKRLKRVFYATNFSDLTVRTTFIDSSLVDSDVAEYLNWELMYVGSRQLQLALSGVPVRGGICIGDVYADRDYVFGPALVKSYALESKYAVFPRVAIDWKALHTDNKDLRPGLWQDKFVRGEDGVFFIDYLFSTFLDYYSFPDAEYPDPWTILREHKTRIEEHIQKITDYDERTKQKYMWIALYHNQVINRLTARIADSHVPKLNQNRISPSILAF